MPPVPRVGFSRRHTSFSIGPRRLQVHVIPPSSSEQETRLGLKAETLMNNKKKKKGNFSRADVLNLAAISVVWAKCVCHSKTHMLKP